MKTKNYIICLLDLHKNRMQRGLFFLQTNKDFLDIGVKFGISGKLKKLLSDRWELHLNEVNDSTETNSPTSYTVVNLIMRLVSSMEKYEKNEGDCRTILLPANTPGDRNDN